MSFFLNLQEDKLHIEREDHIRFSLLFLFPLGHVIFQDKASGQKV